MSGKSPGVGRLVPEYGILTGVWVSKAIDRGYRRPTKVFKSSQQEYIPLYPKITIRFKAFQNDDI